MKQAFFVLLLIFSSGALAQDPATADAWAQKGIDAYMAGNYAESATAFEQAIRLGESDATLHYNAACSHALNQNKEAAFKHLSAAVDRGYANIEHTSGDTDLSLLHDDPRWQAVIERMRVIERRNALRWGGEAFATEYKENLSEEEKLAGLSKIWAEAKFGFANFDLVPELDWDARYLEFIPHVKATKSTYEYYRVLMEFMAALKDGHTNAWPARELQQRMLPMPGFRTGLIEGRVVIRQITHTSAIEAGFRTGQEILAINGEPVKQYAKREVLPYQSASTPHDLDVRVYDYRLLAGDPAERLRLRIRDIDGSVRELDAARLSLEERRKTYPSAFEMEWLDGDIALVRLNSFEQMSAAEEFLQQLNALRERAKGLVIDIRDNGGGNSNVGFRILAHLMNEPFVTETWETPQYTATFRVWGRPQPVYGPHTETHGSAEVTPYEGPIAVLIGPRTYSAAEDFAVAFDYNKRGVLIGETTGGSTGQPVFFDLPGGGGARICSKKNRYPDGTEFVGVGVQPDFVAPWTVAAIREERDPAVERALAWLKTGS